MDKTTNYQSPYYWHKWFAWYPVTMSINIDKKTGVVSERKVWLKTIQRRKTENWGSSWWEYADVTD